MACEDLVMPVFPKVAWTKMPHVLVDAPTCHGDMQSRCFLRCLSEAMRFEEGKPNLATFLIAVSSSEPMTGLDVVPINLMNKMLKEEP